jgi:hypothetical protein
LGPNGLDLLLGNETNITVLFVLEGEKKAHVWAIGSCPLHGSTIFDNCVENTLNQTFFKIIIQAHCHL